jgi:hypothetical protein
MSATPRPNFFLAPKTKDLPKDNSGPFRFASPHAREPFWKCFILSLSNSLVQSLLETCKSIKVKRLFLHLADATHQPWADEIKLARIDLGKGKRVIAGGGKFDSKYNISVPKSKEGGTLDVDAEEGL